MLLPLRIDLVSMAILALCLVRTGRQKHAHVWLMLHSLLWLFGYSEAEAWIRLGRTLLSADSQTRGCAMKLCG